MAELGSLTVSLAANTAKYTEDIGKAMRESRKRMAEIEDAARKAALVITGAFTAAAASATLVMKSYADNADALGKMAQKASMSVEGLSALQYAGKLSDVSMTSLGVALTQLNKSIDAGDPAFKRLGINLVDANGKAKSTETVLREVATRFAGMEAGADKTTIAMELFGKSGADLIPLLNGGAAGLDRMTDEAERFGLIVGADAARAAEEFNDNLTRLRASAEGLAQTFAAPLITNLADLTSQMAAATMAAGSLAGGIAGWFLSDTAEPGVRIQALNEKLERLRVTRDELARPTFANKLNDIIFGDVGDLDRQIAVAEKEIQFLQKVQAEMAGGYYDLGAKPFKAAPADDGKAAVAAAKRVMEAERERARAMQEAAKAMEDMARVEIESALSLNDQRNKWAEEDGLRVQKAFDDAKLHAENIRQSLMTEEQLLVESFLNKQDQLVAARDLEAITQEEYNLLMQDMEADHWEKMGSIRAAAGKKRKDEDKKSMYEYTKDYFSDLAAISAGTAQHNRAMFEANKVAGIANAIVNTYEGISKTMATYAYPFVIPMAAAHAIAGFAQVQAIQGAQFGGGGGAAPSLAGGTAAAPVTPVGGGSSTGADQGGQTTVIQLSGGDMFSRDQVMQLIRRINEEQTYGSRIVLYKDAYHR